MELMSFLVGKNKEVKIFERENHMLIFIWADKRAFRDKGKRRSSRIASFFFRFFQDVIMSLYFLLIMPLFFLSQ